MTSVDDTMYVFFGGITSARSHCFSFCNERNERENQLHSNFEAVRKLVIRNTSDIIDTFVGL